MELFYAFQTDGVQCLLDAEESQHCVKVLRHREGDEVFIIDGLGTMYRCRLADANPRGASASVIEAFPQWGSHPYRLTVGCCPTKNNERFEWFIEKATEIGVDSIVPLIGQRSERKVYKTERARRLALSATKQSLKALLPEIYEPLTVKEFLESSAGNPEGGLKLIAYCFEGETPRTGIMDALEAYDGADVTVLIGPEGDFSPEEASLAISKGYIPVHLGSSRLRTETAALTACEAAYFHFGRR